MADRSTAAKDPRYNPESVPTPWLEEAAAVGQTAVSGSAPLVREPERAAASSNPDDKEEPHVKESRRGS